MVQKAQQWIEENDFDFIITGEVIGQRPMSQRKDTMPVIARESGANERLLRPLCAKNLPETLPEKEGWVNREELYGFSGRTRKPQIALAEQFGFTDYAQPAGGCCFLTDKSYSDKLVDLWTARGKKEYELDDVMLLKVRRHLRQIANFNMIIAREEGENNFLQGYKNVFQTMTTVSHPGPLVLIDGTLSEQDCWLAAQITARYSQGREAEQVEVKMTQQGEEKSFLVTPLSSDEIAKEWHI
jgi:tRNA U34 2-thiouridine synthase MnmA/TrmU